MYVLILQKTPNLYSVIKDVGHDWNQWNFIHAVFPVCYKKQSIRSFFTSLLILVFISWDCQRAINLCQRESYFVCLLLLSWRIFNVTLAFLHGWHCSFLLENSKSIKMHYEVFMTNFESKTCIGCGVWDTFTDCMWSLYTMKETMLTGIQHVFHRAGVGSMQLMIRSQLF